METSTNVTSSNFTCLLLLRTLTIWPRSKRQRRLSVLSDRKYWLIKNSIPWNFTSNRYMSKKRIIYIIKWLLFHILKLSCFRLSIRFFIAFFHLLLFITFLFIARNMHIIYSTLLPSCYSWKMALLHCPVVCSNLSWVRAIYNIISLLFSFYRKICRISSTLSPSRPWKIALS